MNRFAIAALVTAAAGSAALAQTGVDGTIGAEWAGATSILVPYSGASNNASADQVAYRTYFRTDATYAYFAVSQSSGDGGSYNSSVNFANLYFGTSTAINGSTIGMEVTNDRFFVPGVPGYFNNTVSTGVVWSNSGTGTIELAIPFSFFTSDPLAMGYAPATHVWFRTSQSLGYNFVAGSTLNTNMVFGVNERFGIALIPTPGAAALLGLAGLAATRRRR
jgi:hypothetical protein